MCLCACVCERQNSAPLCKLVCCVRETGQWRVLGKSVGQLQNAGSCIRVSSAGFPLNWSIWNSYGWASLRVSSLTSLTDWRPQVLSGVQTDWAHSHGSVPQPQGGERVVGSEKGLIWVWYSLDECGWEKIYTDADCVYTDTNKHSCSPSFTHTYTLHSIICKHAGTHTHTHLILIHKQIDLLSKCICKYLYCTII